MNYLNNFNYLTLLLGVNILLSCAKPISSNEIFFMPDLDYMSPAVEPEQRLHVEIVVSEMVKCKVELLDLVVFKRTEFPVGTHVLRVLGLPGDKVQFTPEGIILNNEKLVLIEELSYLNTEAINYVQRSGKFYCEVPARAFFLIGDNMSKALDSRIFGSVGFDSVYGRVVSIE